MPAPDQARAHLRPLQSLQSQRPGPVPSGLAGEHAIRGFRNADITARLYRRPPADRDEAHQTMRAGLAPHRQASCHGLVAKVPRARRYRVTRYGHRGMTAAITLHDHDYPLRYMTAA